MIRHILLVAFIYGVTPENLHQVREAFQNMPARVEGVSGVEWGVNNSPEIKNAGFIHSVLMTFLDELAWPPKLLHPEHTKLKAIFCPFLHDILVIDYAVYVHITMTGQCRKPIHTPLLIWINDQMCQFFSVSSLELWCCYFMGLGRQSGDLTIHSYGQLINVTPLWLLAVLRCSSWAFLSIKAHKGMS